MPPNSADHDADPGFPGDHDEEFGSIRLEDDEIVVYSLSNPKSWIQSDTHVKLPVEPADGR